VIKRSCRPCRQVLPSKPSDRLTIRDPIICLFCHNSLTPLIHTTNDSAEPRISGCWRFEAWICAMTSRDDWSWIFLSFFTFEFFLPIRDDLVRRARKAAATANNRGSLAQFGKLKLTNWTNTRRASRADKPVCQDCLMAYFWGRIISSLADRGSAPRRSVTSVSTKGRCRSGITNNGTRTWLPPNKFCFRIESFFCELKVVNLDVAIHLVRK